MKITFNLIMIITVFFMLVSCISLNTNIKDVKEKPGRITHNNQDLFLSGINLAWISFGRDLTNFSENDFISALDEISAAGANSVRWWIHVNGSSTPIWDGYYPVGMPENSLDNFEKALDLAWERGILIMPTKLRLILISTLEEPSIEIDCLSFFCPRYLTK